MEIASSLNIFDYATSELSQDAFLFWFINNCKNKDDPNLREFSKQFILKILIEHKAKYNKDLHFDENLDNYTLINYKQEKYSDVVVKFEHDDNRFNFTLLIEDKVFSGENKYNQLLSYKECLDKTNEHSQIVPMYFKTGYELNSDICGHKEKYLFYSYREIFEFFKNYKGNNIILKGWYDVFLNKIYQPIDKALNFSFEGKTLEECQNTCSGQINNWVLFNRLGDELLTEFKTINEGNFRGYYQIVNGQGHADSMYEFYLDKWLTKDMAKKGKCSDEIVKAGNDKIFIYFNLVWGQSGISLYLRTYPKTGYCPQKALKGSAHEEYYQYKNKLAKSVHTLELTGWKPRNSYLLCYQYDLPKDQPINSLNSKISGDLIKIEKVLDNTFLSEL